MSYEAPALEMRVITKSFAGNSVLAGVSLRVAAGEVHALVGENGAGKSTLMKVLAGVHQPDAGEILIEGRPVRFTRPADALAHGVAMIYQELSLAPHLTVAENIFLGREPLRFRALGVVDRREMNERARQLLSDYGFRLDPRARVGRLSAADRQLVEITRATVAARRVVVMDEPTSSLTAHEAEELFRLIRDLKGRGLAIVYISHRLEELSAIADRLTILRDGRAVYAGAWGEISRDEIIRHMAGRELKEIFPPRSSPAGEARLRVERLTLAGKFEGVSFEARAGEASRDLIERLHIRPPDPAKAVGHLSGGNQQKVLLARWLFASSHVFLLDEPTRGVDVAARAEIYRAINGLAEAGAAAVLVSSDLPELLGMSDRILVMRRGRMVAELDAKTTTQEEVLKYAAVEEAEASEA